MKHLISLAPLQGPLPIPHFLGWPDYTDKNTYDIIVPEDFKLSEGDTIVGIGSERVVKTIVERRPAKGDWSKQKIHKSPHFIRLGAI